MTAHQSSIIRYLKDAKEASLQEIYDNVNFGYYHNGNKHLGDVLSRMVKSGMIERVKKGTFRLRTKPLEQKIKNQIKLF